MPRGKPKGLPKSGGRKAGTPNKLTQSAKDAIAMVADGLGGADGMLRWAQADDANERIFWGTIYPKLLPLQVSGEGGGPVLIHKITRTIVRP